MIISYSYNNNSEKTKTDYKYHFIFRYTNPVTGETHEHSPSKKVETSELEKKYKDNKPHLFTLKVILLYLLCLNSPSRVIIIHG